MGLLKYSVQLLITAIFLVCSTKAASNVSLTDVLSPADKPFDTDGSNFDILTRLLNAANLTDAALNGSNYTLFAPNDAAFLRSARYITNFTGPVTDEEAAFDAAVAFVSQGATIGNQTLSAQALLQLVLLYHTVDGVVTSNMLLNNASIIPTIAADGMANILNVGTGELVDGSPATPNPAFVSGQVDIKLMNDVVVHVIDAVLIPVSVEVPLDTLFCTSTS